MAEVAVPLVLLGGMYILSNQNDEENKNTENFTNNMIIEEPSYLVKPTNYPTTSKVQQTNVRRYHNQTQTTDKFYDKNVYVNTEKTNPKLSVGRGNEQVMGLTGAPINKNDFKHNNMVPFFGSKVRGATVDRNVSEGIMDHLQGSGSQYKRKTERAPLFKPQRNLGYSSGAPNTTEFMMSRMNPSMKMANVKPWDEEKVAPGLNLGYTTSSSGSGYNAAVEARNCWLPKTVDQLRSQTNPKLSYSLNGHQGPANSYIKESSTVDTIGRIEKNRPDTYYKSGPNRWFRTTGLEKAQTVRSIHDLQDVSRPETTREYYGGGVANDGKATYVKGQYSEPHSIQLNGPNMPAASAQGQHHATTGDYGIKGFNALANNRSTVKQPENYGHAHGMLRAVVAPLLDILRPSRKENVVGNMRPNGNVKSYVSNMPIYDPADRTKTTIREQTEGLLDNNHLNVEGQQANAYLVSEQQPVSQQRDTTNVQYGGGAGPAAYSSVRTYDAEYNQRNNVNKTYVNRPNQGGMGMLNNYQNIMIRKSEEDRVNGRANAPKAVVPSSQSIQTYGVLNSNPQLYSERRNHDRINPDILTAFKNNPYTKSLNSWA